MDTEDQRMHGDALRLETLRPNLERRGRALKAVRDFFLEKDFLEVETPLRIPCPALELHIDAEPSGSRYLRTSPELHMKRMLAGGYERVFQLGPCFRRGEQGRLHHPEFCMLEWYRAGADYIDILADTRQLLSFVAREVLGTTDLSVRSGTVSLNTGWHVFSISDAFLEHAGWDPVKAYDADRFDRDLVELVEPALPVDAPVILKDYPAEAAALSRRKQDRPEVAERWELYIGGLELANAYSELTDPNEQRLRFEDCAEKRRKLGKEAYSMDTLFLEALESGLPPCAGIALGFDRLVMLLCGADSLEEVTAFQE